MTAAYRGHIVQVRLLAAGAGGGAAGTGAGTGAGRVRARQLLVLERGVPLDQLAAAAPPLEGGRREWQGADRLHVHIRYVRRGGRGTVAVEAQRVRLLAGLLEIPLLLILERPWRWALLRFEVRLGVLGLLQVEAPLQRLCPPLDITPPASHGHCLCL